MKLRYVCVLFILLLVVAGWLFSSSSLLVVENLSQLEISEIAILQHDSLIFDGSISANDYAVVIVRTGYDYGMVVDFEFGDKTRISEDVGYLVPGDIFVGYHKVEVRDDRTLGYTLKDWLRR